MSELAKTIAHFREAREIGSRGIARPTARQWMLHAALFLITAGTTTICGIMMAGPDINHGPDTAGGTGFVGILFMIPRYYLSAIWGLLSHWFSHPYFLGLGLIFSCYLVAVLAAPESGHFLFCRFYGGPASLLCFITDPP